MHSRQLFAVGTALLSAACFDVERVDVARRVEVDDFEDGDQVASTASGFGVWYCASWSTPNVQAVPACGRAPGFASEFGEFLTFFLQGLPNVDYTGVVVGTSTLFGTRDLKSFKSLRFRSKFEPGAPAPAAGTRLLSELVCSAEDPSAADLVTRYYDRDEEKEGVELAGDWSSHDLPLAEFQEPRWQGAFDDEGSCLERVKSIQFFIEPALLDGETAAGTLTIDDVYLE